MRAFVLDAMGIQAERMVGNGESFGFCHRMLTLLDFSVVKLLDLAAIQAHQMVVVLAFIQLIDRLAALEMTSAQNVCLLKLG